jgi:ABC-type sugar transport system permease subunit
MAKRRLSTIEKRRILGDYLFIAPQLILYLTFTILPFFVAIPTLFTDRIDFLDTDVSFIGFRNFTRVFRDEIIRNDFLPALYRTVRFTILNYAMVYVFGLTLALLMYEIGFRGGFFTVIYLPWMVSGLAIGYIVVMLFSRSTGTVNHILLALDWIEKPIDVKLPTGTTVVLPIVVGWRAAGFNMAIFLSGLLTIPRETIEAAVVDGANYWQRLTRVYFPQMWPAFIIATIFCLIGSFGVFQELVALGGLYQNPEAKFLSILFFEYAFLRDRLALGMTLSLEVGAPLIVIGMLLQRLQRRLHYEV